MDSTLTTHYHAQIDDHGQRGIDGVMGRPVAPLMVTKDPLMGYDIISLCFEQRPNQWGIYQSTGHRLQAVDGYCQASV